MTTLLPDIRKQATLRLRARGVSDEEIHRLGTQAGVDDMKRGIEAYCTAIAGPLAPSYDPETGLYTFEVNYDESIDKKTAEDERDPKSLAWVTNYATDEKFPYGRTGTLVCTGRIRHFNRKMGRDEIEQLVTSEGKILARGKELIDFSKSFPRPALDGNMPLVAAGQFWAIDNGNRCYLYLRRDDAKRDLDNVWLYPADQWTGHWHFLVLDM